MAISVFGWGAGAITTAGFGYYSTEWIPLILAECVENSHVYTCVATRDYVDVLLRETGDIVLRVRPDQIPARSKGWPWQGELCLDDEA